MNESTTEDARSDIGGLRIRVMFAVILVLVILVTLLFIGGLKKTNETYAQLMDAADGYMVCEIAASDMKAGSNYLTSQIKEFVITHDIAFLDNYFVEAQDTQRRDRAVAILESYAGSQIAHSYLDESRDASNELMVDELYAAKLVLVATGMQANRGAEVLKAIELSADDSALSSQEKLQRAIDTVFGAAYQENVDEIENDVALCKSSLVEELKNEEETISKELDRLLVVQQALTWALLATFVFIVIITIATVLKPIQSFISKMGANEALPLTGARELRILSRAYNNLYEENIKHNDYLKRKAEHDHLTGLYNRAAFDGLLSAYKESDIALLIIDIDYFKDVNDKYGHDMGDKILQKLGRILGSAFRSSDYACRMGGDEFAVIMTDTTSALKQVISNKVLAFKEKMLDDTDGLPATTLSVGIAFSSDVGEGSEIYKLADEALYRVKEAGRNGYQFYA